MISFLNISAMADESINVVYPENAEDYYMNMHFESKPSGKWSGGLTVSPLTGVWGISGSVVYDETDSALKLGGYMEAKLDEPLSDAGDYIIEATRTDAGWNVPWIIAKVSYHPNYVNDPHYEDVTSRIIKAQTDICNGTDIFEGPATDDMIGEEYRHDTIHFNEKGLIEHGTRWADIVKNVIYHDTSDLYVGNIKVTGSTVIVPVTNTSNNTQSLEGYLAVYKVVDGKEQLMSIYCDEIDSLETDASARFEYNIQDENIEQCVVKKFIWDKNTQGKPITNVMSMVLK